MVLVALGAAGLSAALLLFPREEEEGPAEAAAAAEEVRPGRGARDGAGGRRVLLSGRPRLPPRGPGDGPLPRG